MNHPEVVQYPDAGKVGVTAGRASGGDPVENSLRAFFRKADEVDYFDGET
jgi:hypothetical protein